PLGSAQSRRETYRSESGAPKSTGLRAALIARNRAYPATIALRGSNVSATRACAPEATRTQGFSEEAMKFAQKLNLFDATMIVISGIIGVGIFVNPYIVAQTVKTPFLILAVWAAGGLIALAGAFVFAELSTVLPRVGGQYAFFREAFHPLVAFLH